MKPFDYTAVDNQGRSVRGTIDAVDWSAAKALLAERGLSGCEIAVAPVPAQAPLGMAEAMELAGHLSQLSRSGLPVESGLRAIGKDLPSNKLSVTVTVLAARLEAGESLDSAVRSLAGQLPPHVRELIGACAGSGQLADTLDQVIAQRRETDDLTRRLWQAIAYPAITLALLATWLTCMTLWVLPSLVSVLSDQVEGMSDDFEKPARLKEVAAIAPPLVLGFVLLILVALVVSRMVGGRGAISRLFGLLPLAGPAWRFRGLADFSGLLQTFLGAGLPLHESIRLAGMAARDPAIQNYCPSMSREAEAGQQLNGSLAARPLFPATLVALTRWGEHHAALVPALQTAQEIFRRRFELRIQLVRMIIMPVIFVMVAASVLFIVSDIIQILWVAVRALSSFTGVAGPAEPTVPGVVSVSGNASVLLSALTLLALAGVMKALVPGAIAARTLVRYAGLGLVAIGLLGVCLASVGWLTLLAWPLIMVIWLRAAWLYRTMQKRSLLAGVTLAAAARTPLAPIVRAFVEEEEGAFATRAERFANRLDQGASMQDAVTQARNALPSETKLAANLAAHTGDLAGALAATAPSGDFDTGLWQPLVLRILYVFPMVFFFVIFMKLKVEPSMLAIFRDFDVALPPVTAMVVGGVPTWPGGYLGAGAEILTYLVIGLLFVAAGGIAFWAWLEWMGLVRPRLPVLKRIFNWIDMGPALRMLALAARHNRPLLEPVSAMAYDHPKSAMRQRMADVWRALDNGAAWQQALRGQGLISRADMAVLSAAERAGNLPWALSDMADSFERRASYRVHGLVQVVLPLLILPVGLYIAVLAVAYFAPLVKLVENLG